MDISCRHEHGPVEVAVGPWAVPPLKLKGKPTSARVSASSAIYEGEFIQNVSELEAIEELRFASNGVRVIAAGRTGERRITVVYAQDGNTYVKAAKYEGNALTLGNKLLLAEGVELDVAAVVWADQDTAAVLYNMDAAGQISVIDYLDRTGTLRYTDLWDDGDVCNIAAGQLKPGHLLCSCVRQMQEGGSAYLRTVTIGRERVSLGPETPLNADYDKDEYTGAWSLAALSESEAVISYFKDYAAPVGFSVMDIAGDTVSVRYSGECVYQGSLPCTAVTQLGSGRFAFANGVALLDASGAVLKAVLVSELWELTQYGARPLWYGTDGVDYNVALGRAGAGRMGEALLLSYTADGQAYTLLTDLTAYAPAGNPAVSVGKFEAFTTTVPLNGSYALQVLQREGNGYVKVLHRVDTVIPSAGRADGVARTGAGPGGSIKVILVE